MKIQKKIVRMAVASLWLAAFTGVARGQHVKVWVSSNGGDGMTAKEDREFGKDKGDNPAKADFSINEKVKHQRMEGFGASIME